MHLHSNMHIIDVSQILFRKTGQYIYIIYMYYLKEKNFLLFHRVYVCKPYSYAYGKSKLQLDYISIGDQLRERAKIGK